jgi:hypothetical protein
VHRTLALLADRRVRLTLLFAVLASLAFYLVSSRSGLLGSATGERGEDCPSMGPPSPASVNRAELSGLREELRPVVAGRGAGLYEQGVVDSGYMWSDGLPGTGASLPSGPVHPGAYEMRWWMPDHNDVVADVLAFDSADQAHDFFERASSPRCRTEADAIDAPSPAGGRNLVWRNPDGFAQEDLFLQHGRRVYRVGTVLAGLSHRVTFIGRIAGFLLVNELGCALPGADCGQQGYGNVLAVAAERRMLAAADQGGERSRSWVERWVAFGVFSRAI